MFFQNTFLHILFSSFYSFYEKWSIWGPLPPKSSGRQNWIQNQTSGATLSNNPWVFPAQESFFRDQLFLKTIVITVSFGPSVFLKVTLSMEVSSFYVFLVFLCSIVWIAFLSFVYNTTVNVYPLRLPFVFEKINPHSKTFSFCFSNVGSLRLRFSIVVIFSLIFGYPLPPTEPDWSNFW